MGVYMPRHMPIAPVQLPRLPSSSKLEDDIQHASVLRPDELYTGFTRQTDTMAPRKNTQSTVAEISLVHLKNCLVNLPSSLVSLLVNVNTVGCPPKLPRLPRY